MVGEASRGGRELCWKPPRHLPPEVLIVRNGEREREKGKDERRATTRRMEKKRIWTIEMPKAPRS